MHADDCPGIEHRVNEKMRAVFDVGMSVRIQLGLLPAFSYLMLNCASPEVINRVLKPDCGGG